MLQSIKYNRIKFDVITVNPKHCSLITDQGMEFIVNNLASKSLIIVDEKTHQIINTLQPLAIEYDSDEGVISVIAYLATNTNLTHLKVMDITDYREIGYLPDNHQSILTKSPYPLNSQTNEEFILKVMCMPR